MWLADAREELLELAEGSEIPVVKTMMGLSLLPTDHPLNMGMIGAHGNHCANQALAKADLLIMVGTRAADRAVVDPREIQRRMATIHIDVDPAEIGKNMQAAIPLVGNVKVILRQILDRGAPVTNSAAWLEQLTDFRRAELNRRFPHREGYVFPGTVLRKLGARLDDDAVVCVDVGQNQIFTCKYLPQIITGWEKSYICTCQEQHKPNVCIQDSNCNFHQCPLHQMQSQHLKHKEKYNNRKQ